MGHAKFHDFKKRHFLNQNYMRKISFSIKRAIVAFIAFIALMALANFLVINYYQIKQKKASALVEDRKSVV